jgi:CheY-like chemotaxis protein
MTVNARDAMDGEGLLTVQVASVDRLPATRTHDTKAGSFVAISVVDTGPGVAVGLMDRVFEPFFTTKEVGKGTGLGLSQVFGFTKQSGGDVVVENHPVGARFTIYLPRVAGDLVDAGDLDEVRAIQGDTGHGRRVLVVEDNVEVGTFSTQLLRDLGYETTWAANGMEALAYLDGGQSFDVVFSDVVMPA